MGECLDIVLVVLLRKDDSSCSESCYFFFNTLFQTQHAMQSFGKLFATPIELQPIFSSLDLDVEPEMSMDR